MSQDLNPLLSRVIEAGYQLSPEAYNLLRGLSQDEAEALIEKAIIKANIDLEARFILDERLLTSLMREPTRQTVAPARTIRPLAADMAPKLKLLQEEVAQPAGDAEGFIEYFKSRFERLEAILRRRVDVKEAVPIARALQLPVKTKLKVIGMVTEKRTSGPRYFLEIEDRSDTITIMATDPLVVRKGLEVLEDQVICVYAVKFSEDLLIANDFIWPDIPTSAPRRASEPVCAAFISDVHIGSRYFREDLFDRFISWMNLELGPPPSRDLASRVKYVIIGGDLVDGIGIYPEQLEELTIRDIREQYHAASQLLSRIPDYVEIIVIPGNHDASRKSLPQPPIPRNYAEDLYADKRIHLLENPCRLSLHGVEVLLDHGTALNDILGSTPGHDFHRPITAMELLLRCRHLAPRYGQNAPIAPEKTDRLVIQSVPDIFQAGHIHIHETRKYKNVTLISSGGWQDQTPYQRRMNLTPTTGVATIFDLQTHQAFNLDFNRLT